jgi:hypothetical protein
VGKIAQLSAIMIAVPGNFSHPTVICFSAFASVVQADKSDATAILNVRHAAVRQYCSGIAVDFGANAAQASSASYIENGGWATFPGMTSRGHGVAQACADLLTALQ